MNIQVRSVAAKRGITAKYHLQQSLSALSLFNFSVYSCKNVTVTVPPCIYNLQLIEQSVHSTEDTADRCSGNVGTDTYTIGCLSCRLVY